MKVIVQSSEQLTVVVPSDTNTYASIAIQTDRGTDVATIGVDSGLISDVREFVCRRQPVAFVAPAEDRLTLWAHLVSEHASCIGLDMSLADLVQAHEHEHTGPGTIRNHPRESRAAHLPKVILALSESDHYGVPRMSNNQLQRHVGLVNREITIRLGGVDSPYKGTVATGDDKDDCREED